MFTRTFAFIVMVVAGVTCRVGAEPLSSSSPSAHDMPAYDLSAADGLLDILVRPALISAPALSTDGHFLSGLRRQETGPSTVTVWYLDDGFEGGETLPYSRDDLQWMAWVGGGRLLMSLEEGGLVLYDAHIKRLRPLIENGGPRPDELPPFLLSPLLADPTTILMQWEDPSEPGFPAVFRVNAVTGESQKIISAWRPIVRWWASPEGEVRLGEGFTGRKQRIYGRRADGGWQQISKLDFFDGPVRGLLAVETGGATAVVLSAHASDTRELWRMDTTTGDLVQRLAGHPEYDIAAALISPVTDMTVGASYVDDRRREIIWQARELKEYQRIADLIGAESIELVSASRDGRRSLFRHRSSQKPVRYFIYDYETHSVTPIPGAEEYEALPQRRVRTVDIPLEGMDRPMQAVLSSPLSGHTGKAVVLVHGGPVRRVTTAYSDTVAWLVANGFSVLQPNFRGSAGYGETWRQAGYGEWGRKMQSDVRTAAEWLVREGITRKRHMCVMGGSYGGYAALMSSIMDDDLFACAVSLNGVTSIPHLVSYLKQRRFALLTTPRIEGRLSDRTLKRRSPLFRVDLVRTPLLMLHATEDANVPFEQGQMMARELRRHDKPHEFIVLEGAEHILRAPEDRHLYLSRAVSFMQEHIAEAVRNEW